MTNKQLGIGIALLFIAALAVNASGLNLKRFLPAQQSGTSTITPQDEQRPVMTKERSTASDGGRVQYGQGARRAYPPQGQEFVEFEQALPGVGQRGKGGPGSVDMDAWYRQHPESLQDEFGNAAQIGDGRPAEVPGLP